MGPLGQHWASAAVAWFILIALDGGFPLVRSSPTAPGIKIRAPDTASIELDCVDRAVINTTLVWFNRTSEADSWKEFVKRAKVSVPARDQDYQCRKSDSTVILQVAVRIDPSSASNVGWICAVVILFIVCLGLSLVLGWKYVPRWWRRRSVLVEEDSSPKIEGDAEVVTVSTSAKDCDAGYVIPIADPGRRGTYSDMYMEIEDRVDSNSHYEDPKRRSETGSPLYENVACLQRNRR